MCLIVLPNVIPAPSKPCYHLPRVTTARERESPLLTSIAPTSLSRDTPESSFPQTAKPKCLEREVGPDFIDSDQCLQGDNLDFICTDLYTL